MIINANYRVGFSGYCPEQGQDYSIDVVFTEIRMIGMKKPEYKKGSFYCEYGADCGCAVEDNRRESEGGCPIYRAARFNG
jgi:hypothetical protein